MIRPLALLAAALALPACTGGATLPTGAGSVAISPPSLAATATGPVTYTLTYSNVVAITLTAADVSLVAGGTAAGSVSVSTIDPRKRLVTVSGISGSGTLAIQLAPGTAINSFGLPFPGAGPSASFAVDDTGPTLTISAPSPSLTNGGDVQFGITYSGAAAITLSAADVTLQATGTAAGTVSVSGTTVIVSGISGDGTLGISLVAGTASDAAGNLAPAAGPSTSFTVDTTPPGVSIGSPSASLTRGGPVTFTIAYTGALALSLDPADVGLNATGTASGTVSVSGTTVTVSGISGDGTLGISLVAGTASDAAGNLAPAAGPSATFTVDNTAPTLSISEPSSSIQGPSPVTYTLSYQGADAITLDADDVILNTTGTADADLAVSGTGATRTVTLSGISGTGTLGISVVALTAMDNAGNAAPAAGPSTSFTVDTTPPGVSIAAPVLGSGTATYTVSYTDAAFVSLDAADVVLNAKGGASGTVSVVGLDIVISSMAGFGSLSVSLMPGTAMDAAGNPAPAAGPSTAFSVDDGVSPGITSVSPAELNPGDTIFVDGVRFGAVQGAGQLRISGVAATVTFWSDTHIEATVPTGARTGLVVVDLPGVGSAEGFVIVLWVPKNPTNRAVSTATQDQVEPRIATDGQGGAFIVWVDRRIPGNNDIYAQRVDDTGATLWASGGIPIASTAAHEAAARIVPDGAGGAIIAWSGGGSFDIHAQRIDGAGNALWTPGGVNVAAHSGSQDLIDAAPDGAGGILLTWIYVGGVPGPSWNNVWAQRVSPAGVPLWSPAGVVVGAQGDHSGDPRIVAHGSGGAFVTWMTGTEDVRAQRVRPSGAIRWGLAGAPLCSLPVRRGRPRPVAKGIDGLIVVWHDYRPDGLTTDLYAQRLDVAGARQWGPDGLPVSAAADYQAMHEVAPDGAGGAIVAWVDGRNGFGGATLYGQRLNGAGAPQWLLDGLQLSSSTGGAEELRIVPDGLGGATVAWQEWGTWTAHDVLGQRVDAAGTLLWPAAGRPVSTADSHQEYPQVAADPWGGAIFTWQDTRVSGYDVYAQGVSPAGQ